MKKTKLAQIGAGVLLIFLLLGLPAKAHAHADFLVTVGRMATVVPAVVLRGGAFLLEGAFDGILEGIFDRKGFLHGESRYM